MENEPIEPTDAVEVTEPQVDQQPEPEKAPSRRDALAKAMEAIDKREAAAEKPAETEKAAAEKAEPAEKPAEAKATPKAEGEQPKAEDGQPRNADGTFAAKEAEKADTAKDGADAASAEVKSADAPPPRFSADAKAEWDKAPPSVRGEINRAIRELEGGLQQKDAALEPFKPYMQLAQQHGVDLSKTLEGYVEIDRMLGTDPRQAFQMIARNMGVTLPDLISMVTGEESTSTPDDYQALQFHQEVSALQQRVAAAEAALQQQRTEAVGREIEAFAAAHPRFDELLPEMTRMLETGFAENLEKAYTMADRLNPASPTVQAAPPQDATPPAPQTRTAKSITGAPGSGSDPARRRPADTRKSAIAAAFDAAGL